MPSPPDEAPARGPSVDEGDFVRLWQAAPDAMVAVDSAGAMCLVNRRAEVLFGYGPGELVGQPVELLLPEASRQIHPAHRSSRAADPQPRSMASVPGLAGRRQDGTEFPVEISLSSIETAAGPLVSAAVHDLTDRTEPDQDLRRIAAIIEHSGDAIVSVSLDDIITSWNPAAERLYGYTAAQARGKPASMLVPPGHGDDVAEILARVTRGERVEHYETYRITQDSRIIDVSVSASPIRDPHGNLIGVSTIARDITERMRADRDRQRMASIIECSDDAIISNSLDGVITSWNPAAEQLYGYTAAEARGKPASMLVPPGHGDDAAEIIARVTRGERVEYYETSQISKDSTFIDVSVSASPIRDPHGNLIGVSTIARNITAIKKADRDLQRMASIIECSDDAIISVSLDDTIISWNPAAERSYGYPAAEARGRSAAMLIPPGHDDDIAEIIARVTRGERVAYYESSRISNDARIMDVSVSASPIRDPHGNLIGVSTIARDITDLKRADRDLQRMASIIEYSDDAIVSKSLDGVITSWNPAAEQLYGYTAAEAQDRSAAMLVPSGHDDDIAEILARVTRGERVEHYETSQIGKDSTLIDVSVSASPIRDPHGNLIGVSTIARDITDRKKAEATVRALNAELEHRVAERTAELAEAVEELGAFSYSVSHDLRAPLRAIDGFSRIVLEEYGSLLDAEGRRLLNVIRGATTDMTALIDDLLSFSRIGRQPIRMAEIDMRDLASAVAQDLALTFQDRDVSITVGALPPAYGDRALIRQVLVNLLSNAVKFTASREHAQIDVTGEVEGDQSVYSVKDNGVGFDMAYHEKLFQVFQRLHPNQFEGTGVGLAIVQRIVRRHGGRIWADGRVDHGATFFFALPTEAKEAR